MTDQRPRDMTTRDVPPREMLMDTVVKAVGPAERRHTVSLWFYLLGAVAFLIGCYLLFMEDGVQSRALQPTLSPRTELIDGGSLTARLDATRISMTSASISAESDGGAAGGPVPFSGSFIDSVWREAELAGVQRSTFDRAFAANRLSDPEIIALSARQPEFDRAVGDYVASIVNADRIAVGRARLEQQTSILDAIEKRYGVDRAVLLAIWGIESNFGLAKGDRSVVRSLATLASADMRRAPFWRSELTAALTILERDKIPLERLVGSWAGAMGHTQFMPSTYVKHGVDFDGDGVRDIWGSVPDALASSARYLQASGWVAGRPWGREVVLPQVFDFALASPGAGRTMTAWRVLGVRAQAGTLPVDDGTIWQTITPAGAGGPAFLVSANFDALLSYNRAYSYAIAVGALADRISGGAGIQAAWPASDLPMSRDQRIELQEILVSLGFDTGGIDGVLGTKSREAIRAFQKLKGTAADGHPSLVLLDRMRTERRL